MTLTDAAIRAMKPLEGRTHKLSDGGGLQLWVAPSGSKLWNIAYRYGGKQLKLSLGAYPAVGLKDAREQRDAAKRLLAAGIDPGQQKKTAALAKANTEANTFAVIADELLVKKMREGLEPATLQKVQWLLDFARPTLGARPVAALLRRKSFSCSGASKDADGTKPQSVSGQPSVSVSVMLSPAGERIPTRLLRSKEP
jgi:hypothetical protein